MNIKKTQDSGFTLIELLVVISIIALLLSILMPSLGRAKAIAKKMVCTSNNRQWSIATAQYTTDWNDSFPIVTSSGYDRYPNIDFFRDVTYYTSSAVFNGARGIDYDLVSAFIKPYVGEANFMECPSRRGSLYESSNWKAIFEDADNGVRAGYITGDYAYFPNPYNPDKLASHIELHESRRNLLPLKLSKASSGMALVSDVTYERRLEGIWAYAHPWGRPGKEEPVGACAGFVDGSARWVDFDDMAVVFEYSHVSYDYYWPSPR